MDSTPLLIQHQSPFGLVPLYLIQPSSSLSSAAILLRTRRNHLGLPLNSPSLPLSPAQINAIEAGIRFPSATQLRAYCTFLDLDPLIPTLLLSGIALTPASRDPIYLLDTKRSLILIPSSVWYPHQTEAESHIQQLAIFRRFKKRKLCNPPQSL